MKNVPMKKNSGYNQIDIRTINPAHETPKTLQLRKA